MEVSVTLSTTKEWADDFLRRLTKEGFSQNQLAAGMNKSPTQVSRWFTKNPKRRVTPTLETVTDAELVLKRMVENRKRREQRAEAKDYSEGSSMNE